MARRCFYSFHYKPDAQRAAQIRQIGAIEGNKPASDNDWETVKKGGDTAIKKWIAGQMYGKSCTIVLVGAGTAGRKWIKHEIKESWEQNMGVVGIYIHGIKDLHGNTSLKGCNPFDDLVFKDSGKKLSSIVKCYNPPGRASKEKYAWISANLAAMVEEAIAIRSTHRV